MASDVTAAADQQVCEERKTAEERRKFELEIGKRKSCCKSEIMMLIMKEVREECKY